MSSSSSSLSDEAEGRIPDIPDTPNEFDDINNSSEDEVSALHDFIAGGIAGSASVVVGHPFDTIKVRLQTSSSSPASLFSAASSFGGISSLFRGIGAPLSSAAAVNAIIFSSYGVSSRLYDQLLIEPNSTNIESSVDDEEDYDERDPWQKSFLCGSFAGLVQCVVICPMEHVKCRIQIQHGKGAADNIYSGPGQASISILRSHGIRGLFRGWWATCIREVPAFGLYFSTYDYIKDNVNTFLAQRSGVVDENDAMPMQHSHAWLASAFAGGVSGCVTWAAVYPIDVIKTRIQTSPFDAPVSTLGAGRHIVSKHGVRFLFRGLGITMIRAFPVNGTIFPIYEFTLNQLNSFGKQF